MERTDGKVARVTAWVEDGATERKVVWSPGYDCRVRCVHTEEGKHGQHGDELTLFMRNLSGQFALTLNLFTYVRDQQFVKEFAHRVPSENITCPSLFFHQPFPTSDEEIREGTQPTPCELLAGGGCYSRSLSSSLAEQTWKIADSIALAPHLLGSKVEQIILSLTSGAWDRMADLLWSLRQTAIAERAAAPEQCPHCKGQGLLRQKTGEPT